MAKPNIIFVFADQWRAQATGYAGNHVVQTPNLDRLAEKCINFPNATSGCPVCTPYRGSLLTGQYPLTTGLFVNDVTLDNKAVSIAQAFKSNGYDTAYIGKWHVDGQGRSAFIPPDRQQGFDYWKTLECTHTYNESYYYQDSGDEKLTWQGYDAFAQTDDARQYIANHKKGKPFFMMLSWGPPHAPLDTAPQEFREMYRPEDIQLRPNVPQELAERARQWLCGYYAHCSALDKCIGELMATLDETGIADDTIFIFTSDHGDMLGSQGLEKKQKPWDESIRVPFLLRWPKIKNAPKTCNALIDAPDIMPTLLSLCNLEIPDTVQGYDYANYIKTGKTDPANGACVLACYHPFGQWRENMDGGTQALTGREFRGLRTKRYTYVRTLKDGPWLLYDNEADPYQQTNLIDSDQHKKLIADLDTDLQKRLDARGDKFLPGTEYIKQFNYTVDQHGTVPYEW